jgi:hypothetical protein
VGRGPTDAVELSHHERVARAEHVERAGEAGPVDHRAAAGVLVDPIGRDTDRPFLFPGSAAQWNGLTDMTDARLLARQLEWASITPAARNQAFNVVNGDVFRWNWMWARIAEWFGLQPAPFSGRGTPLEQQLADAAPTWREIAQRHGLTEPDLNRLASAWHTDADLGRPIDVVTDMSKSRKLGFLDYQATDDSFFDLVRHAATGPHHSLGRVEGGASAKKRR